MILLPLIGLAGCATGPGLQSRMAAYVGDSAQGLVQSMGVPDKQITVNGIQYFAYDRHHEEIDNDDIAFGGFGPFGGGYGRGGFYGGGFYGPGIGLPSQINVYSCETTFMLKDDRVFNFTLRGNDCG